MSLIRRMRRGDQGAVLITALIVSWVLIGLVALMFTQLSHTNDQSGADRRRTTAFHVAEAGVNDAIANLAVNVSYTGGAGSVAAGGSTLGTFTTTVVDPGPGVTNDRAITSTAALGSQTRTIKQIVRLNPLGGFNYAIFSNSALGFSNYLNVIGNTYSTQATVLQNNTTINGDLKSPESITTANNATINGDVWSGANVVISTGSTITGNVLATGSVTIQNNAKVTGDVRAASITNNGTVQGQQVLASQTPPVTQALPTFSYNAANYTAPLGPPVNMTSLQLQTCWDTGVGCPAGVSRTAMRGVYYISDGGTVTAPNQKTTLTGDLYIITNGRLVIQRDFDTSASGTYRLVLISTSTSTSPPAVAWSNNVTLPANLQTFIYARGLVSFTNLKSFSGIVYGGEVTTDQNFSITYEPSLRTIVPGFTWDLSSAGAYEIKPLTWQECASPSC